MRNVIAKFLTWFRPNVVKLEARVTALERVIDRMQMHVIEHEARIDDLEQSLAQRWWSK
jgi:uncharacterized coiled-coil protein SlyX